MSGSRLAQLKNVNFVDANSCLHSVVAVDLLASCHDYESNPKELQHTENTSVQIIRSDRRL